MEKSVIFLVLAIIGTFVGVAMTKHKPDSVLFYDVCYGGLTNCSTSGNKDFVLLLDSSEEKLQMLNNTERPSHDVNYVAVQVKSSDIVYRLPLLIRKSLLKEKKCNYVGTFEPFLQCEESSTGAFNGFSVVKPEQETENAETQLERFKQALEATNDTALQQRYTLHIGRCYENMNDFDNALDWYQKRTTMGGWSQEMFYAQYRVGYCYLAKNETDKAKEAMLDAYKIDPHRKEPLYYLARMARNQKDYSSCLLFARSAMQIGVPWLNAYYVESHIYRWGVLDEYAVCLYYTGLQSTAKHYWEQLVELPDIPEADRARIKKNLLYA